MTEDLTIPPEQVQDNLETVNIGASGPDMVPGSFEAELSEAERENRALFHDPSVLSYAIRRHGRTQPNGAVNRENYPEIHATASGLLDNFPEGATVKLFVSSSGMPDGNLFQYRAIETAANYALPIIERDMLQGDNLVTDQITPEIGDIVENYSPVSEANISELFKVLHSAYGGMNQSFWTDYYAGKLPGDVADVLKRVDGETSVEKAGKLIGFITQPERTFGQQTGEETAKTKRIGMMISHEEVIGSFTYQLGSFMESVGGDPAHVELLHNVRFSYNEGIDVHYNGDTGGLFVKVGDSMVCVDAKAYGEYLAHEKQR